MGIEYAPFIMIVLIVLITVGSGVINNYFKMKNAQAEHKANDVDIDRMQAQIDQLTERVRVLEKLATDDERGLRDEFKRLA